MIENKYVDINHKNEQEHYCLSSSINYTSNNLSIIKYLIEDQNMNTEYLLKDKENFLLRSCKNYSKGINFYKYFTQKFRIDINCVDDDGNNCLFMLCDNYSQNIEIFKYFIEECKIDINHVIGIPVHFWTGMPITHRVLFGLLCIDQIINIIIRLNTLDNLCYVYF